MKITIKSLCNRQLDTKTNRYSEGNESKRKQGDPQLWRDILAFWILGLTTEFGYCVIICAAHDIMQGFGPSSDKNAESLKASDDPVSIRHNVCNTPSAGILLIADIAPSMLMNILCPFLPTVKNYRVMAIIALNLISFLLIANAEAEYCAIIGVILTSIAEGMGEVTMLSYSAQFDKKILTAWASGTGSAGIIGSISWAGLIALGVSPRDTLRIMMIVPFIEGAAFWLLLRAPQDRTPEINRENNRKNLDISAIESNERPSECVESQTNTEKLSGFKAKLKFLPKLASYFIPLHLVFIFEYVCVSALFEMIYIDKSWLEQQSQYRWFLVAYQIGVFASRSMGSLLKPRRTWWAPVVQFANLSFFAYLAINLNPSNPFVVFSFVFGLGIFGGLCYCLTFHRLVKELPLYQQKFSLGLLTVAESFGTALGAILSIPIHALLCGKLFIDH